MMTRHKTNILILGIMGLINLLAIYQFHFAGNTNLVDEGGLIENVTAIAYLFSAVLIFFSSLGRSGFERRLSQLFAVTCMLFFLREMELEEYNLPEWVFFIGDGVGRNIIFVSLYALIILSTIFVYSSGLTKRVLNCFRSEVSLIVLAGSTCLLIGSFFDKTQWVFLEEIMEMNGGLLISLAAILHLKVPISAESVDLVQSQSK